jgi:hypothetical protein
LRQNLQAHASQHKWLPGLDRRRVPVRALHSALNFIVTSSEAIICKRWLVRVHAELCARFKYGWDGDVVLVLWVHDELVACCRPEIAAEVGTIMVRHAVEPAEFYGFKTPLAAEFKVGPSWANEPQVTPGDIDAVNAALAREGTIDTKTTKGNPDVGNAERNTDPDSVGNSRRETDPDLSNGNAAHHPQHCADTPRVAVAGGVSETSGNGADPARGRGIINSDAGQSHGNTGPKQGRRIATYIYAHPEQPNYLRVDKHNNHQFYQHHWNGKRWVHGVKGTYAETKIPYRLPELIAAPPAEPVWICEGRRTPTTSPRSD